LDKRCGFWAPTIEHGVGTGWGASCFASWSMKENYAVLSVLLISLLYALYFGKPAENTNVTVCKHNMFNGVEEGKYSYIYSSMILGCKQKADKEHYNYLPYFYNTGTGHLLCIAGLHIGSLTMVIFLLVNFVLYLFAPSLRRKGIPYFWFSLPVGIIASVLYVYFIGPEIPRLRAIIMLVFGAASFFLPALRNKLLVLSITASIILFFMPDSIYSYSFYYSFIAVFGIFLSSKRKTIYVCTAIYLFLLPLSLHSSGSFDVNNITANLVVIPFFSLIYYPLNVVMMLLFAGGLHGVIHIMNTSTEVLLLLLKFFSRISDFTKVQTFNITVTEVLILYSVLLLLFFSFRCSRKLNKRVALRIYSAAGAIALSTVFYIAHEYRSKKEVTDFEIQKPRMYNGSGDIVLINTGSENIVVDTGFGKFSSQKAIREIKRNKVDKIDHLIITHIDLDHSGGLSDFLSQFHVGNVIISHSEYDHVLENGLLKRSNFVFACDGTYVKLKDAGVIEFVHPACGQKIKASNDSVLAFVLSLGDYKFMFNSDMPHEELEKLLKKHDVKGPNLIYQMSHHCNKKDNLRDQLNKIKPQLGFCTRDKTLLKRAVLDQNEFNFPILMTGVCGSINLRLENRGLAVFSQKCPRFSLQLKKT
jgi:competence protein ComEC